MERQDDKQCSGEENHSLEISASVAEKVTFATHQNDIPVIADLSIRNSTDRPYENLTLQLTCDTGVLASRTWKLDRVAAQGEIRIRDRQVRLEGAKLGELNERLKSTVRFELKKEEEVLATSEHELIGLARNEWGGANYMPELLAAFVTPNDPAVARLLKAAGEALRRSGFQPALNGYQSKSRKHVWQIVSALWAAVSEQRFVYAEPPASFEVDGQKVRTPTSIVEDGLMTCLDCALLFAACAEQAGLNSIVVFTKGHAFCGVWLQPQELPTLTLEDATELRKYSSLKDIVLFETTFAVHEPPVSFSKAIAEAERLISEENEADFIYALDIKRARTRQISPLPIFGEKVARGPQESQQVRIAVEAPPDLPGFDIGVTDEPTPDTPETRLDHWQRKLLDLSNRNRLLNLRKSKTAITLRCHAPAELEDKLADGKKITVIPMVHLQKDGSPRDEYLFRDRTGDDFKQQFVEQALERNEIVSELDDKELTSGLVQLYRKAKSDLKEGGANTLFLAFGMLKWKRDDNRAYRAPLILLPVTLERRSAKSKVKIVHHDDEPVFNMTLLQMLRQDFDLALPELQGKLPQDESGIDVNRIWRYVQQHVRDIPGFEVAEEIVLSTFSFAKFLMWKDLSERTDQLKNSELVKHLIETPREPYGRSAGFISPDEIDERIDPKDLFLPLPADASQIAAIHASTLEGDFILEGPPGTGKSQTIANIIAQNMALGKRILFVSEKMAALEVVYRRLRDVGLGDFCLELHSNKANKKAVLEQLGRSWHNRASNTQSVWHEQARKLKEVRDGLNSYVRELHRPSHSGISPRKAIGWAVRFRDSYPLRLDWSGGLSLDRIASTEGYDKVCKIASDLGAMWAALTPDDRAAFSGVARTEWSMAWQRNATNAAREVRAKLAELKSAGSDFLERLSVSYQPSTIESFENLAVLAKYVPIAADNNLAFGLDSSDGAECLEALEGTLGVLAEYQEGKSRLSIDYSDDAIHSAPLANWLASWKKTQASWFLLRFIRERIARRSVAKFANSKVNPSVSNDLAVLEELQARSRLLLDFGRKYPQVRLWQGPTSNRAEIEVCIQAAKSIRNATSRLALGLDQLPALRSAVYQTFVEGRELLSSTMPAAHSAARFTKVWLEFQACLSDFAKQVNLCVATGMTVQEVEDTAAGVIGRESRLKTWCQWQTTSVNARDAGLEALVAALEGGILDAEQCKPAFQTAYSAWLAERLIDDREELRTFSSIAHEENIRLFGELDSKLATLSTECIRAKLSGDIPDPASPVRQQGYGVLARELQKKMRHKPIRELVGEMGTVLTDLTPCLMMSPLSVAQFLSADAGPLFDLVVFDEASQITVWDAIGAIARGKNAIIVGDPKQMPPTSFFDRSAEDEDDYETEDLESILDEAMASSVKWHRLTGHYRSRHESLIAFSNHRYYQGDLITYPSSDTKESSVHFRKVEGRYQRGSGRTNPEEAQAVVSEVVQRLKKAGERYQSLGIVTLNSEQQRLIDDLLDDARRRDPSLERFFSDDIEEPVFVKNLETVQGDQRDVILLSIGYGPDTPGANTMSMNFGPLNRKGGERRLNVAITRATTEVVLFASFEPSMIDLTRTSAAAVRDLKHYMEFAQRGPRALGEAIQSVGGYDQYDSEFEREVADQLRQRGWSVQTQIGVSKFRVDLGVVHPDEPGKFLAGIECDGATYHSLPSARDRDRVRQTILEGLGWRLVRIWSTDYFVDPQSSIKKAHAVLTELLEQSKAHEDQLERTSSVLGSMDESEGDEITEISHREPAEHIGKAATSSVSKASPQITDASLLSPDLFYDQDYKKVLRAYAANIIDDVGPINFAVLCEKIARAHGFLRTGKQIKGQIWSSISHARKHVRAPDKHTVFWPENVEPSPVFGYRGLSLADGKRTWADVPYPEKLGLATKILRTRSSADPIHIICRLVGISRLTKTTRAALADLLADAARHLEVVA